MSRIGTDSYSINNSIGRGTIKLLFYVACILLFITLVIETFIGKVDDEMVYNVSRNALNGPEGLMKLRLFKDLIEFPTLACLQLVSLIFLIYTVIIGVRLVVKSREITAALLILSCAILYISSLSVLSTDFSTYSSLSLVVIIISVLTGIYILIRGVGDSYIGVLGIALILFGLEMIWPRHYHLSNHSLHYSGFWMSLLSITPIYSILYASKALLCDDESEDEIVYEECEDIVETD